MQQLARYPLLISADLEAGSGMRFDDTEINFPWNMAVAATGNPEYPQARSADSARSASYGSAAGANAPVVDVNNNAEIP